MRNPQQTKHSSFVTDEQLSELVEGLQAAMDKQIELISELLEQKFKTSLEQLKEKLQSQFDEHTRRLDRGGKSTVGLARFLRDEVLPAIERRLPDDPQHPELVITDNSGKREFIGIVPDGYAPAKICGHYAPEGRDRCESLLCLGARLQIPE